MRLLSVLLIIVALASPAAGDAFDFPPADGMTWCFLGDSITEQHMHVDYIESYFTLRYPDKQFHFRRCGRGGSTLPEALERFDPDVWIWEPDVVSLEMGLNGNATKAEFTANLNNVTDRTEGIGAESVYYSMHPYYRAGGGSQIIRDRADAFVEVGTARGLSYVDQFYEVLPVWEENLASPNPVELFPPGETGHPGPAGHLIKTWVLLKGMGAPAEVSSARLDASSGSLVSSASCAISNVTKTSTGISFTRLDERLPIAVDVEALEGLETRPQIMDEISAYMLEVDGLAPGLYRVLIDGVESAIVNAGELADGWNMSTMTAGPIFDQLQQVRDMILEKQGTDSALPLSVLKRRLQARYYEDLYDIHGQELVDFMKGEHPTLPTPSGLTTDILPLDEAIHLAAQPGAHDFEIELVPEPAGAVLLLAGAAVLLRGKR